MVFQHAVGGIQTKSCSVIFCQKKANIKVSLTNLSSEDIE